MRTHQRGVNQSDFEEEVAEQGFIDKWKIHNGLLVLADGAKTSSVQLRG